MIVTIAGSIASGKTTLARGLAEKLGIKYVSAGSIMRSMAEEAGASLIEYSKHAEENPEIDKTVDERQKQLASSGYCVVDGRLGAYFLDADFKVFLTAPLEVRTKRLGGREKTADPAAEILAREGSERTRYKRIYGIDVTDLSVYDLILNTGKFTVEEMVDVVYSAVQKLRR